MKTTSIFFCSLLLAVLAHGQIIHVPADQPTIQAGIDIATTGDTVLVAEGTYYENIHFLGKAITVASHYILDADTSHISNTIINGNKQGTVVDMSHVFDSIAILSGFHITNGKKFGDGAGIYCSVANVSLQNLKITNCEVHPDSWGYGGAGGGIISTNAVIIIKEVEISGCSAIDGAGIYTANSTVTMEVTIISNNIASSRGGGLFCDMSLLEFSLNSKITQNDAELAGGFYNQGTENTILFNSEERGSILLNTANRCQDIYSNVALNVSLDTFSVIYPTSFFAQLPKESTFDIQHGIIQQVSADLYVSPEGDNSNSGLNSEDPLKTIYFSICKILADSLNPHTIHLSEGTFSQSINGERFPVCPPDYITISGISRQNTILDAEELKPVIRIFNNKSSVISSLTVTGGTNDNYYGGAGIFCLASNLVLQDLKVSGNNGSNGGGITSEGSTITFQDVKIDSNSAYNGGGCYFKNTRAECHALDVKYNMATHLGGGISTVNSNLDFNNVLIENNYASNGGGIAATVTGLILAGTTIRNNQAEKGGGIYSEGAAILNFDADNRCNVYLNKAENGADIFTESLLDIIVDTFTVIQPTLYHVSSIHQYTFDILHGKIQQVNADCYVSPDGDNNNSGLTSNEPIKNINAAISKMQVDSVLYLTIHLMEGTYSLSSTGEVFPLKINPFIHMKGVDKHLVILDAEGQRGVLMLDYNNTSILSNFTVKGAGIIQNTVYPCIRLRYSDCRLQNMIITGNEGHGIKCYNSNPLLDSLAITNNGYSGIDLSYSNPVIQNCIISDNQRSGGINCYYSDPVMRNLIISGNSSYKGGGISCYYSHPVIDSVVIENNIATSLFYYGTGGGMYCNNSSPQLTNASIKGNTAIKGGGIYTTNNSIPVIQNVRIENNLADHGGAVYATSSPAVIKTSIAQGNTASLFGGGICSYFSDIELTDVTISGNTALKGGGAYLAAPSNPVLSNVSFTNNNASEDGGAVYCLHSNPFLINVLMAANSAINGGGVYCSFAQPFISNATISDNTSSYGGAFLSSRLSSTSLVNSILWNNAPQEIYFSDIDELSKITISYTNIKGGLEGIITNGNAEITWMEGNIDADPSFIGDGNFPYALCSDSPCIDSGTPDTTGLMLTLNDIAGNPRIYNKRIDMGAYEWNNLGNVELDQQNPANSLICFPNPFSSRITFKFTTSENCEVSIKVFNHMGQLVADLLNESKASGQHQLSWNAAHLPPGLYFLRLQAGNEVRTGKVIKY